jgi:hypothetical protein
MVVESSSESFLPFYQSSRRNIPKTEVLTLTDLLISYSDHPFSSTQKVWASGFHSTIWGLDIPCDVWKVGRNVNRSNIFDNILLSIVLNVSA